MNYSIPIKINAKLQYILKIVIGILFELILSVSFKAISVPLTDTLSLSATVPLIANGESSWSDHVVTTEVEF